MWSHDNHTILHSFDAQDASLLRYMIFFFNYIFKKKISSHPVFFFVVDRVVYLFGDINCHKFLVVSDQCKSLTTWILEKNADAYEERRIQTLSIASSDVCNHHSLSIYIFKKKTNKKTNFHFQFSSVRNRFCNRSWIQSYDTVKSKQQIVCLHFDWRFAYKVLKQFFFFLNSLWGNKNFDLGSENIFFF